MAARRLIRVLVLLLLAAAIAAAAGPARRRPNLVVVLADDLGWGDLSCTGHPRFRTPNLDRLAGDGIRLTRFYAPVPFCAPSRASLLTGRLPPRCGMTGNPLPLADPAGRPELDALGLPPDEVTLAEALKPHGYRTACFGKWHLGHRPPFRPLRQGFDEYLGVLYSNDMHRVELVEGDRVVEYPVVQATLTRRLTERALRFVEENRRRPFLLYLPQPMPHKPLAASEQFYKKSGAGLYGDALAELDWSVGEVRRRIRELGLERDTLIVFASDNGPWFGGSTGGLRGMKSQVWEGGIRVPLIAAWPGRIPPGRTSAALGTLADLFPTCLEAAGVPGPGRLLDGRSLLPLFAGGEGPVREEVFAFQGERLTAVIESRWKLVLGPIPANHDRPWRPDEPYTDPRAPDGVRILAPCEQYHPSAHPGSTAGPRARDGLLFDLERDPAEREDVSAAYPEVVLRLRRKAQRWTASLRAMQ